MNDVVFVVAMDKGTGYIKTTTSCDKVDAPRYAKYYRSIGYNSRVVDDDGLERMMENEYAERRKKSL